MFSPVIVQPIQVIGQCVCVSGGLAGLLCVANHLSHSGVLGAGIVSPQDVVVMTHCCILSTADILGGLSHYLCLSEAPGEKVCECQSTGGAVWLCTLHTRWTECGRGCGSGSGGGM